MDKNYLISAKVKIGKKARIEDYVTIGIEKNNLNTKIGKNAKIRSHSVIYGGNTIGNNFQTGHGVLIRESNKIGKNVSLGSHSVIEHHVQIGNNVRIHTNVFIPEYTIIEDEVWIGPCAVFTNAKYPNSPNAKNTLKGAHVKKGAIISANVTILPGVIIGRKALIGAGSVVTKDVPDKAVVVGNPGKIINLINKLPYV